MRVFINGGTGLLGSHIAVQLLRDGHEVTLFARNPYAVPALKALPGVTLCPGDYYDEQALSKALPGHDACVTTVPSWGDTARTMLDNDTRPSVMLMELAAEAGIRSFVYTSSTAALGEFRHDMGEEMMTKPAAGWDLYCATKRASELFLLGLSFKCDMRCNVIRPGSFFGRPAVEGGRMHRDDVFERIVRRPWPARPSI